MAALASPSAQLPKVTFSSKGNSSRNPGDPFTPWVNKQKLFDALQVNLDSEAQHLLTKCDKLLDNEKQFTESINRQLEKRELCGQRKREVLNRRWNEHVYDPARRDLLATMVACDTRSLNSLPLTPASSLLGPDTGKRAQTSPSPNLNPIEARAKLYDDYINYVNWKGTAFLDTYAPDEYYPFAWRSCELRLPKRRTNLAAHDPLQVHEYKRLQEELLLFECEHGSRDGYRLGDVELITGASGLPGLVPSTRDTSSFVPDVFRIPKRSQLWHRQFGPEGGRNASHMPLPWVAFEEGAPQGPPLAHLLDLELRTQKKRFYPEVSRRMNRVPTRFWPPSAFAPDQFEDVEEAGMGSGSLSPLEPLPAIGSSSSSAAPGPATGATLSESGNSTGALPDN